MLIDDLLTQTKQHINEPEAFPTLTIPKVWGQGRTAYGGISAAMIFAAMQQKVEAGRPMRSFNCNFVGPLMLEQPFSIEVEILRQGKNASQVVARAMQDGNTSVLCQACFGVAKQSKIKVINQDKHDMALPKKAKFLPQIPKVTPKFLRFFDLAISKGSLPFTGSKKSKVHGWMRYSTPPVEISDAHLIGLIDSWPPTVLQMLRWPAPASTMCWNVEFIHPHSTLKPTDWFAYQAHTRQAEDGYAHTEANIWDQQGELIAISRQTVAIFD